MLLAPVPFGSLAVSADAEPGWVVATIRAARLESSRTGAPLEIVAVMDRSGSMSGNKLRLAKLALKYLLTQLEYKDKLSVVAFNGTHTPNLDVLTCVCVCAQAMPSVSLNCDMSAMTPVMVWVV